jgi:lipopolysaccharide transport system ATP-binding protein
MSKEEIRRKFDEIVAFAEVEKFIDTPVKRYSSGMYVRLAFAVAAHLEPEILIVDEVLAVGDVEFQKKCLGKMQEVGNEGRTVLFVSHNMSSVMDLCENCLLLKSGSIIMTGSSEDVVKFYLDKGNKLYSVITHTNLIDDKNEISIINIRICQNDTETTVINCREEFKIVIEHQVNRVVPNSRIFLMFRNKKGEIIFCTSDYDEYLPEAMERKVGRFVSTVVIPKNLMKIGTVFVTVGADLKGERYIFIEDDILEFEVIEIGGNQLCERHERDGIVAPILAWTIRTIN